MRVLLLIAFSLSSFFLFAQDCLPEWGYYRPITISNDGPGLTDHTVALYMDLWDLMTAGKLQSDALDLRFVDGDCNLLSHYFPSITIGGTTEIWLKVPELPTNGTVDIQAYYGNPTAGSGLDGDGAFLFFDDFSEEEVNFDKWEPIGSYQKLEVSEGIFSYASDGANPGPRFKFVRTAMSFSEPVVIDFAAEIANSNGFGFSSADVVLDRILFRQSGFGFDTLNQVAFMQDTFSNGISVEQFYPVIRYPRNEMQNATLLAGINGMDQLQVNYFSNNDLNSTNSDTYVLEAVNMSGFHFILSSFIGFQINMDYIRIRPYSSNAIDGVIGMEEVILSTNQVRQETDFYLFPNPAQGQIWLRSGINESGLLRVFDSRGQLMQEQTMVLQAGQASPIQVGNWPNGMYFAVFVDASSGISIFQQQLQIVR